MWLRKSKKGAFSVNPLTFDTIPMKPIGIDQKTMRAMVAAQKTKVRIFFSYGFIPRFCQTTSKG